MTQAAEASQPQGGDTKKQRATYLEIIKQYEKEYANWQDKARQIVKRYMDDRNARQTNRRRYNILWSNVQTLLPALYYQPPKPNVERRFRDKDPVGRTASDLLERACSYFIHDCEFHASAEQAVLDRLLGGRGTLWFRYVPHFKDAAIQGTPEEQEQGYEVSDGAEAAEAAENPVPEQELDYEEVCTDYVHPEDFGHNVCRTWSEVNTVWRKAYLTREESIARFGEEVGSKIPLDHSPLDIKSAREIDESRKSTIYELWDKAKKQAVWLHKDVPELLDVKDDPLGLKNFFPCPAPLYATLANNDLIPSPDYKQYQDQAAEMDELTARIHSLTKAVKVAGVYDSSAAGLANLLSEGIENRMVPVDNWAMFAEKGGMKGAVDWFPLEQVVETLVSLNEARDKVKEIIYEITGMSDIVRGASDPNETAAAQNIKGNYANMRLGKQQSAVSRFLRDGVQIMAEIIAQHVSRQTLSMITGIELFTAQEKQQIQMQQQQAQAMAQQQAAQMAAQQQGQPQLPGQPQQQAAPAQPPQPPPLPPDVQEKLEQPTWEEVEQLLHNNAMLHFRIGIETDSTIKLDQEQDKGSRIEALEAIGQFLQQAASAPPVLHPLMGEALMFLVRGFKSARGLESAVEDFIDQVQKNPAPNGNPQAMQAQADLQKAQIQKDTAIQTAQIKEQAANQRAQTELQANSALEMQKLQAQQAREKMKLQGQMVMENVRINADKEAAHLMANRPQAPR